MSLFINQKKTHSNPQNKVRCIQKKKEEGKSAKSFYEIGDLSISK